MRYYRSTLVFVLAFATSWSSNQSLHAQGFSAAASLTNCLVHKAAIDGNDNVYVVGNFSGTIDIDPGPGLQNLVAVGNDNMFLLKRDAAGNFLWAKHFPGRANANASAVLGPFQVALDAQGNVYIAGAFRDTFDFDPGPNEFKMGSPQNSTSSFFSGFVLKLNAAGNFIWAKKIGGGINDQASFRDLVVDGSILYLIGTCSGTVDVDPGPNVVSLTGGAILEKLDTAGNFLWVKVMTGFGFHLAKDDSANLYILGGAPPGTNDFDPGPGVANITSIGSDDIYIQKFDSAGNHLWVKLIGGLGSDLGQGIAVDKFGNVLATGYYAAGSTIDFDPGPGVYNITSSSRDMFVLRLRTNGDFSWAISIHPGGNDDARAITTDGQGNVYTTGEFFSGADFDPGPGVYSLGGGVYVQKLDSSGNFLWARAWGANMPEWIGLDHSNNIYVIGDYNTSTDFDPGPGVYTLNGGANGAFIEKLCGSALSLTTSNTVICSGSSVQISTPAIAGATYAWRKDGIDIAGTSNTINVSQAGWYEVYENGGCPSASAPVYLAVVPTLHPTISISGPSGELVGQPVTINATVANAGPSYSINWKNNGVSFAITTVPSVTYIKQAGADTITAFITSTSPGCYDSTLSNMYRVYDATGITENMKAAGVEVYPNPFGSVVIVNGLKVKDRVDLTDITGRVVYTWQATEPTHMFAIEDLSAGYYILRIMSENGAVRVNVAVIKR